MARQYDDFELVIQSSGERYPVRLLTLPREVSGEFEALFTRVELRNFYGRIGQMHRTIRRVDSPDLEVDSLLKMF